MSFLYFAAANARWLAAGLLIAFSSSFGQTFFIGVFAGSLKSEFDLGHGAFGMIYMAATLASAATLIQLGRAADSSAERLVLAAVMLCFAAVCVGMSWISSVWMLLLAIYGLRLCGQGMMSHLSMSYVARWFERNRGRALAIAGFGFPIGEAITPVVAVALIAAIGWRASWLSAAAFLVFVSLPVLWLLLGRRRVPAAATSDAAAIADGGLDGRHCTRAEATRQPVFWAVLFGEVGPSFILTVVFFLPAHIAEVKGWTLDQVTATYSLYAFVGVGASFVIGALVDRFDARSCLPFYQIPLAAGLIALALAEDISGLWLAMALLGATQGGAGALISSLWAELYGVRHIGAIRSVAHAGMVFASALGPGAVGALLDFGVPFETQLVWMAIYTLAICVLFEGLRRHFSRRARCAALGAAP